MRWLIPLAALLALAPFARADEQFPRASISTTGDAIIYAKPDMVCVSFGIETFDPSLDKAKQLNDQQAARLVKAVKEVGVEDRLLQVDTMTIELRYRENGNPINGIQGYIARRYYRAELKDLKLLDKLVDAVMKNGANQFGGLEFRTSELRKYRDEARKMALKAAKEKADLMAKELGATVAAPRTITEGGGYVGYYNRNSNFLGNAQQQAAAPAPAGDAGGEETMPLGQIAIQASVSVSFDLK